jgi:ribosome maturation factor RimP
LATKTDQLIDMLQPVVEGMGFIFWGLEYLSQGRHSTLRIYIDHEDGINVDNCADVSRQLSAVLDVEDPITSNYTLEVSSPGLDRLLFTSEQFAAYRGHIIDVRLRSAFEGRRKFKGLLNGIEDNEVLLIVDEEEFMLPLEQIERAQVVPQFDDE